ncbi:unnamed protein product [Prorocentrum cordatum]|uniref:Uncharacterized protein n=1 Tax=Prorocentrum cordatum TaxID=2364126 RepID=A0ABN9PDI2_9DINO|nr:unnamed protein product [Polarella glacialis]
MAAGAADAAAGGVPKEEEEVQPIVKQPEEMTQQERSDFALRCKEVGNRGFKAGEWDYAILSYQEGLRYLQYAPHDAEFQPDRSFDHGGEAGLARDMALAVDLYNNLCHRTVRGAAERGRSAARSGLLHGGAAAGRWQPEGALPAGQGLPGARRVRPRLRGCPGVAEGRAR